MLFDDTVDVDNGNSDYTSGNYTTTAAGNFFWIARYSGDDNNSAVSGECGDTGETSVVNRAPSSISTAQSFRPQDSATITGAGTLGGTVTFKLYRS
jgi:hypothetical protein